MPPKTVPDHVLSSNKQIETRDGVTTGLSDRLRKCADKHIELWRTCAGRPGSIGTASQSPTPKYPFGTRLLAIMTLLMSAWSRQVEFCLFAAVDQNASIDSAREE